MKPIVDFILEHIETVNESFQSSIVQGWKEKCGKYDGWKWMMKDFQWDKVTDADLEWHDQAEAKKLAYKRNETWILFWIGNDDSLIGYTISNYSFIPFDRYYQRIKNIMPIVRDSKGAYSLSDELSTRFLREKREEAKKNALALKSAEEVRDENLKRYEKTLKEMRIKNGSIIAEIRARMDELTQRYKEVFEYLFETEEETYTEKLKKISEISKKYSDAVYLIAKCSEEYDREKEGRAYFSTLNEKIKDANDDVQKFLTMYKV